MSSPTCTTTEPITRKIRPRHLIIQSTDLAIGPPPRVRQLLTELLPAQRFRIESMTRFSLERQAHRPDPFECLRKDVRHPRPWVRSSTGRRSEGSQRATLRRDL